MFLDTSFCVDLLREQHRHENGPATIKLSRMGDSPVFISLFVLCELQAGARLSKIPEQELHKVSVFSPGWFKLFTRTVHLRLFMAKLRRISVKLELPYPLWIFLLPLQRNSMVFQ